jgi:hypothetical protein
MKIYPLLHSFLFHKQRLTALFLMIAIMGHYVTRPFILLLSGLILHIILNKQIHTLYTY